MGFLTSLRQTLWLTEVSASRILSLIGLMLLIGALDVVGVGLVPVFLASFVTDSLSTTLPFPNKVLEQLNSFSFSQRTSYLGGVLIIVFVAKNLLTYWGQVTLLKIALDELRKLKSKLFRIYQELPYTFHMVTDSSRVLNSILLRSTQVTENALMGFLKLAADSIVITPIFLMLVYTSLSLTLVIASTLVLFGIIYRFVLKPKIQVLGNSSNLAPQKTAQVIISALRGTREVRIFNAEETFQNQVDNACQEYASSIGKFGALKILPRYTLEAAIVSATLVLAIIQTQRGESGIIIVTELSVFVAAGARLLPLLNSLITGFLNIRFASPALSDLVDDINYIDTFREEHPTNTDQSFEIQTFNHLDIKDLTYRYPNTNEDVLQNIILSLKAGDRIGIVGESGSGKSTLINILTGLLEPTSADIQVNGQTGNLSDKGWQNLISYIPQEVFLFDATVRENITLHPSYVDHERLDNALRKAALDEVIEGLPNGVETTIGENGTRLSGGQRQRLALARAFYHQRKVIFLDEATSALDNETEAAIVNALDKIGPDMTVIMIAHRLSSLKFCNRILEVKGGKISSLDTHSLFSNPDTLATFNDNPCAET